MIQTSSSSQPTSLRSSIDYKERHGNNDQKSRRSSFVENLILEYKTQSNKKSMKTNINQSARYYDDHEQQQQCFSHQKVSGRAKQVDKLLFMKENGNVPNTYTLGNKNKKDNEPPSSVERKLFSNITNNNNNNTQKDIINYPESLSSPNDDFEMNFLEKYKSAEISRKDILSNNNRNVNNTTTKPNINRTSHNNKCNDIKAKTMLMTNKNNNSRECQFEPEEEYSSEILRNIMFSNNINTISRERFVKKGVLINCGNNNNNDNNNNNNNNSKSNNNNKTKTTTNNNNNNTHHRGNNEESTQKQQQQQQQNITKDNSNIRQKLNQFSKQFNNNFNQCIKMLLVQQKEERTQEGLDLLLKMKKGLKEFVDECCGNANNNNNNNNNINKNIHHNDKEMNDSESTMITTHIEMMEFLCLSLYELFVTSRYDEHQQQQQYKQHENLLKLEQKLESKYGQLTNKLSLSLVNNNNNNKLTIAKTTLNNCYVIVKLNRLNNLLLSLSKKRITLSNSSSSINKNTINNNSNNNKEEFPIVIVIDEKINKLIKEIKELLEEENNNNNNYDNDNGVSSSKSLLSTMIKLIEEEELFTTTTTVHNDYINNNHNNNINHNHESNHHDNKLNTLSRLTILSERLLESNHELMFFIKEFAHQIDKNNLQSKSNNFSNQHLKTNEENHFLPEHHHHDGLLEMLFIKVINQSETIMFNRVRRELLSLLLSSYSDNNCIDMLLSEFDHKENLVELRRAIQEALNDEEEEQELSELSTKHINKHKCNELFSSEEQESLIEQQLFLKCKVHIEKLVIFKIVIKILEHKQLNKHQDSKIEIKKELLMYLEDEFKRLFSNGCYSRKSKSLCSELLKDKNNIEQEPEHHSKQEEQQFSIITTTYIALEYPKLFVIWYELIELTNRYQSFYLVNMLEQMSSYTLVRINKMDKFNKVNNSSKHEHQNNYPSHHHCREEHMYKLRELMKLLEQKLLIIYYELGELVKCYSYLYKVMYGDGDDGVIDCIDSIITTTTTDNNNNSKKDIYELFILWKLCYIKGEEQQEEEELQYEQQLFYEEQEQLLLNQKELKELTIILLYQLVYQLGQEYKNNNNNNNNHHHKKCSLSLSLIEKVFDNVFDEYDDKDIMGDDKEEEEEQEEKEEQLYKSLTIRTSEVKVLMLLVYFETELIKIKTACYSLNDNNNINYINNNNNMVNPSSSSIIMNTYENDDDDNNEFESYNLNNHLEYEPSLKSSSSSLYYDKPQHNHNNYKEEQEQQPPIIMRKLKQLLSNNNNNNSYNKPIEYHTKSINTNIKLLSNILYRSEEKIIINNLEEPEDKIITKTYHRQEHSLFKSIFNDLKCDFDAYLNSNL